MAAKAHNEKTLRDWWSQYEAAGWKIRQLADNTDVSEKTWQSRLTSCRRRLKVTEPDGRNDAGVPLDAKQRQRYEDRITRLETEKRQLARELNAAEDFRKEIFGLVSAPI